MNRFSWNIPFGIALSVSAHLSLITLLNGAIGWPASVAPSQRPEVVVPEDKMETYPTFRDESDSETEIKSPTSVLQSVSKVEPRALPALPEIPEVPEVKAEPEPLAKPLPMIKIQPDDKFPVLIP